MSPLGRSPRRRLGGLAVAALALAAAGCRLGALSFHCSGDGQCGPGGVCSGGQCLVPAPDCASGFKGYNDGTCAGHDLGGGPDLGGNDGPPPACTGITVLTLAGTGTAGFVDGSGLTAEFKQPDGILADGSTGDLFVADAGNARVRKVAADGTTSTYAGPMGLYQPVRLANTFQFMYIADPTNDAIMEVSFPPFGTPTRLVSLSNLHAVAVDATNALYTSDGCAIYRYDNTQMKLQTFIGSSSLCGFADGNGAVARFGNVTDLVFDDANRIWIVDKANFRVRLMANGLVSTLAGSTSGSADGQGAAAQFRMPTAVAVDNQAQVGYIADDTVIRKVTLDGTVTTVVGANAGFVDGNGCVAKFTQLHGIAFFGGALYVVDLNRVRKIILP